MDEAKLSTTEASHSIRYSRRPDSALNVYLRAVKSILEDAGRNLSRRDIHALREILVLELEQAE